MKPLIITGDIAALGGIAAAVLHILPELAGTVTALLGAIWYCMLIYDKLKKRKIQDDA